MIATVAVVDLLYGCFVSPFFVENYVKNNWEQSSAYCSFYTFFFTFHDLFAPLCLVVLSIYISLKFTGVTAELKHKRGIYFGLAVGVISVSLLLSIPATYNVSPSTLSSHVVVKNSKLSSKRENKEEYFVTRII